MTKCVGIIGLLLFIAPPQAGASDFQSPRTNGLGGAGHAGPVLNDAIYLNPSFSSFLPAYSISANYLSHYGSGTAAYGRNYNVSIQDGRSELFQAGVAFTQRDDARFVHVGASKSFVQRLGVGVGGKFVLPSPTREGAERPVVRDLTVATTGIVADWLQAALIVDNVVETEDLTKMGLYREFILGLKVNLKGILMLYGDPHYIPSLPEPQRFGYEVGAEFTVMNDFFLRGGTFKNSFIASNAMYGEGFSVGAGWMAPKLALDYGLKRVTAPVEATVHVFGATVFF